MIHSLSKKNIFDEMIIPPSPGDSGSAIGAANFAFLEKTKNKALNFNSVFLGPEKNFINKNEIRENFFVKINITDNFINDTANKLIEGEIIASYHGRNEVGPRSLGNTSIFCFCPILSCSSLNLSSTEFAEKSSDIVKRDQQDNVNIFVNVFIVLLLNVYYLILLSPKNLYKIITQK